jgi:hypothetical protein
LIVAAAVATEVFSAKLNDEDEVKVGAVESATTGVDAVITILADSEAVNAAMEVDEPVT